MRSIYKYHINNSNGGVIEGPITKILTAQEQRGCIVVWAEVDTEKENKVFDFVIIGTGWPLDPSKNKECVLDTHNYLSTVQLASGMLVFHVYYKEIIPVPEKSREGVNKKATAGVEMSKNIDKAKKESYTVTTVINPEILAHFIR